MCNIEFYINTLIKNYYINFKIYLGEKQLFPTKEYVCITITIMDNCTAIRYFICVTYRRINDIIFVYKKLQLIINYFSLWLVMNVSFYRTSIIVMKAECSSHRFLQNPSYVRLHASSIEDIYIRLPLLMTHRFTYVHIIFFIFL